MSCNRQEKDQRTCFDDIAKINFDVHIYSLGVHIFSSFPTNHQILSHPQSTESHTTCFIASLSCNFAFCYRFLKLLDGLDEWTDETDSQNY